jgi:hypothetical protein
MMRNVVTLSVMMRNVVTLSVILLNVFMLSVVILSVMVSLETNPENNRLCKSVFNI